MATVGIDAPLYRSNAPITIFAEERTKMSTRKRTNKSAQSEVVVEQEPQIEVVAEVEPKAEIEAEAPTSAAEEAAEPQPSVAVVEAEQPKTRRCPRHHMYFPAEDEMRPYPTEYRFNKTTGKLQGTYCLRCSAKQHVEYYHSRKADFTKPTKDDQLADLRQQLGDKEAQLVDAEERITYLESEIARLEALVSDATLGQD